jgi:hypothetical protein
MSVPGIQKTSGAVPPAISVRRASWYAAVSVPPGSYSSVASAYASSIESLTDW